MCSKVALIRDNEASAAQILCLRLDRALAISGALISEKLAATLTNFDFFACSEYKSEAEQVVLACLTGLRNVSTTTALFALEATAAQAYFGLWQELSINWTKASGKTIPEVGEHSVLEARK